VGSEAAVCVPPRAYKIALLCEYRWVIVVVLLMDMRKFREISTLEIDNQFQIVAIYDPQASLHSQGSG